jgi:hypothetical protein
LPAEVVITELPLGFLLADLAARLLPNYIPCLVNDIRLDPQAAK